MQLLYQMFIVSGLLLDDALKPAMPLTNGAINENQLIFDEVKAYKKLCQAFGPPWCNTCRMWQLL